MKKHIFGFAIFSLIVGVTVLISKLLSFAVTETDVYMIKNQPQEERRTYCRMRDYRSFEKPKVKIDQAVLDLKTKQLKTYVSLMPQIEADKYRTVLLHFFVKDGGKTRYLSSEDIWVKGSFEAQNEAILTSLKWLDESESYDNLYIVPEIENDKTNYKNLSPVFDYSTAVPVLLSKGKGF